MPLNFPAQAGFLSRTNIRAAWITGAGSRQQLRHPGCFRRRPRKSIRRLAACRGSTVHGSLCCVFLTVTPLPQRFECWVYDTTAKPVCQYIWKCFYDVFLSRKCQIVSTSQMCDLTIPRHCAILIHRKFSILFHGRRIFLCRARSKAETWI